eukprot:scaffold19515_cov31-Tisochrysis_lutea.AAC.8
MWFRRAEPAVNDEPCLPRVSHLRQFIQKGALNQTTWLAKDSAFDAVPQGVGLGMLQHCAPLQHGVRHAAAAHQRSLTD